jgi:hypothetical protein
MPTKVLPVTQEKFLDCVVVRVEDYYAPGAYPKLPKGYRGPTCEFCGKPVRDSKPFHVTGVAGTVILICSVDDVAKMENDPGFMGAWPIGSECARRVRKAITDIGLDPDKYVVRLEVPPPA